MDTLKALCQAALGSDRIDRAQQDAGRCTVCYYSNDYYGDRVCVEQIPSAE